MVNQVISVVISVISHFAHFFVIKKNNFLNDAGARPCSQSMAGCGNEAAEMVNPAGAPTYNSGEGMTYMPSTQSGVYDSDQSPEIS